MRKENLTFSDHITLGIFHSKIVESLKENMSEDRIPKCSILDENEQYIFIRVKGVQIKNKWLPPHRFVFHKTTGELKYYKRGSRPTQQEIDAIKDNYSIGLS